MKQLQASSARRPAALQTGAQARVAILLLLAACLASGFAGGAYWYYHRTRSLAAEATQGDPTAGGTARLSEATRAVLKSLAAPVEVRYYALLSSGPSSESLRAFAGRVDHLLALYEAEAGPNLKVSRRDATSGANAEDATSDGIRALVLNDGTECFLGLTVASGDQMESIPRLSPEWEPALESDLSRLIERMGRPKASVPPSRDPVRAKQPVVEEVRSLIPNLGAVTLEQGKQILRQAALKDFTEAAHQMEIKRREAEQQVSAAEAGQSAAKLQEARNHLRQLQTEQTEKLKTIAQKLQDQIAALEYLKNAAVPSAGSP